MEVRDIVQETGIKTIRMEKKCKKAKRLSGEALQIAVKKREAKNKTTQSKKWLEDQNRYFFQKDIQMGFSEHIVAYFPLFFFSLH